MGTAISDPLIAQNNVVRFSVRGRVRDQDVITHLNMQLLGAPGSTSNLKGSQTLAALQVSYRANVLPSLSAQYSVSRYELRICVGADPIVPPPAAGKPGRKLLYAAYYPANGDPAVDVGALAGEILPTANAVLINQFTNNPGRGGNGNLRLGPILETQQADGRLTAGGLIVWENVSDWWSDLVAVTVAGVTDNYRPGVFQIRQYLRPNLISVDPSPFLIPIGAHSVNANIRTQVTRRGRSFGAY